MGRGDDDDFEEDDFSLSDGTEDEQDASESEASVPDDDDDEEEEDDDDEEEEDDESDFEGAKPTATKAKPAAAAPKGKKAAPAAKAVKSGKAASAAAPVKKASGGRATPVTKPSGGKPTSSPKAPAAKAAEKPAPSIKGDPTAHVLDYMRKTNRPYSMLNVFENLHRAIAKPALTKILDNLADKGELASKLYGKAKIYYMNQDNLPVPSEQERQDVEDQIKLVEADCAGLEQELKGAESALSSINAQISDADLEKMLVQLEEEAAAMEKKLANLERPDRPPIPAGKKDALKRKFTTYRTAWVSRKRIATDAVNQISDGMEKKPKDVYDMIGLETDADAGVKEIPAI